MNYDKQWLTNTLTLRYDPNIKTTLPPITWSDVTSDARNTQKTVEEKLKLSITEYISTRKPRRVSLALSGGVDSILTLILLRDLFPELKIQCISFGFSPDDLDVTVASEFARKYNADFEKFFFDNFFSDLPRQIWVVGEPKINYYWYTVAKKAKQYSNILITGDGGDELFSGYVFRYKKYLDMLKPKSTWQERVVLYLNCHNRDWVEDQDKMFGPAACFSWNSIYKSLRSFFDNTLSPLQQVCLADYHGKLARDWVPAHAKIYSSLHMSGFSPFLDSNLMRYAFTIPMNKKYDYKSNTGKRILRKILNEKNCVVDTSKRGFTPDLTLFWNNYGKKFVTQFLANKSQVTENGFINNKWIRHALKIVDKNNDARYINKLLHVGGFEVWYRLFVSKDMDASVTL